MSKPKFTPGPWIAQTEAGITTKKGLCNVIQKKGPMFILIDGVGHNEAQANAALIAAAPELYDAAEYLLRNLDTFMFETAKEQLKAKLAKARGES